MELEWDEAKRQSNLAKHGIDFRAIRRIFDGRRVITEPRSQEGEERHLTTGMIDAVCITVVWTKRGEAIRLISARRARDAENRAYRALHG